MKRWLSYYHPKLAVFLVYMLQQVEYNPAKFFQWIIQKPDLTRVMHRQRLVWTHKAGLLVSVISFFYLFYILLAILYLIIFPVFGLITILVAPFLIVLITYTIVLFGCFSKELLACLITSPPQAYQTGQQFL